MKNLSPVAQRIIFMDSLPAKNLAETSQILTTIDRHKYDDTYRNRLTHSIEVGEFCRLISINFELKKERVEENVNIGLAHDLGHCPLGHEGADTLNECMLSAGLEEGFKDNSNNFSILMNNNLFFTDYTLVGLIKYPDEIYSEHTFLLEKLDKICEQEAKETGGKKRKTTIGSQIMDLADTISYGGSDIVDGFTTGYTVEYFEDFIKKCILLSGNTEVKQSFENIMNNIDSKRVIRDQMALIKLTFVNDVILDKNVVKFATKEYEFILEEMQRFSFKYFIRNPKIKRSRTIRNNKFKKVVQTLIANPELLPSTLYMNKYNEAKSKIDKLKVIRDCIGDMSDTYVFNLYKRFKRDGVFVDNKNCKHTK